MTEAQLVEVTKLFDSFDVLDISEEGQPGMVTVRVRSHPEFAYVELDIHDSGYTTRWCQPLAIEGSRWIEIYSDADIFEYAARV